jgi:hypothetical protein
MVECFKFLTTDDFGPVNSLCSYQVYKLCSSKSLLQLGVAYDGVHKLIIPQQRSNQVASDV